MRAKLPNARLHRLLLRLHPRHFRQRFGKQSDRLFLEWVGAAQGDLQRRRRGRRALIEASATLVAAWGDELARRTGRAGRALVAGLTMARRGTVAGFRSARVRPAQTLTVVLTVAIAVGANAALFSLARTLLLRPLPYDDADRLVRLEGGPVVSFAGQDFRLQEAFTTLPGLAGATYFVQGGSANLAGDAETARVRLAQVAGGFFEVAGVGMPVGRGILDGDSGEPVAVLSHRLWRQSFAADPEILERTLTMNGRTYSIIGVAPPEVDFPAETAVWLPLPFTLDFYGNAFGADALARLEPSADVDTLNTLLAARFDDPDNRDESGAAIVPPPRLVPLRRFLLRDISAPFLTLAGAASLVLLLGGLNLAGLWSSQIAERVDELRLRRALGASRGRILADLVAETVAVALVGGFAAILVARSAVSALGTQLPPSIPGQAAIADDAVTAIAALGLSLVAGLTFGGVAALGASRLERGATRRSRDGVESQRLQTALVIGQGALALVLVAGAGLMVRSFQELASAPLGFDPEGTLTFQVRLAGTDTSPESAAAYARELETRLAALPGVVAVGLTDLPPLSFEMGYAVQLRNLGESRDQPAFAVAMKASDDYFAAAGIPMLEGLPFDQQREGEPGLVVDARVASELFPNGAAAGRVVEVLEVIAGEQVWREVEIRAVVGRIHAHGVRESAYPAVYYDLRRNPSHSLGAIVRVQGNPNRLADSVRSAVLAVRPTVAPYNVRSLRSLASSLIESDRGLALVVSAFSLTALALAALGLYGLTARQVTRRRREYGVRLALGATTTHLVSGAVRRGLVLGVAAVLVGLPGALAGARMLRSRLFGVEPFDPFVLALGSAFLLAVVLVATWVPARRISRVDPSEALAG